MKIFKKCHSLIIFENVYSMLSLFSHECPAVQEASKVLTENRGRVNQANLICRDCCTKNAKKAVVGVPHNIFRKKTVAFGRTTNFSQTVEVNFISKRYS